MHNKIAIEEHFVTPELTRVIADVGWSPAAWRRVTERLIDLDDRLAQMDALGIEMQLLSLASDGIQGIVDTAEAVAVAREANDSLARIVTDHPTRFAGLAALPMQDPELAMAELARAVRELGFRGALVNGFSDAAEGAWYLDDARYLEFWGLVAQLDVPLYLHPRDPLPDQQRIYEGHPHLLGAPWAFGVETATHALRLITSGLFDRLPDLQVVLGHLGETLPFAITRLEQRMSNIPTVSLEREPRQVLRENFHITTSGNYHTPSLVGILLELGADRVLFATDHPFEDMREGVAWFDQSPISDADRMKIGRTNAERLFRL